MNATATRPAKTTKTEAKTVTFWEVLSKDNQVIYRCSRKPQAQGYAETRGKGSTIRSVEAPQGKRLPLTIAELHDIGESALALTLYAAVTADNIVHVVASKEQAEAFVMTYNRHKSRGELEAVVVAGTFTPSLEAK